MLFSTTIVILINALGALQFTSPKNDFGEAKCGQNLYKLFSVLEPFWEAFRHCFPINSGRGHLLE